MMKQRTISKEISIQGIALHSGKSVTLTFKPAGINEGILFRRTDLYGKPEIRPHISAVSDLLRCTTIGSGTVQIHTVEHVLSALSGMGIHNVSIEIDGEEPPALDGSAKIFTHLLYEAEPIELDEEQKVFPLQLPISVTQGNRSLIALPYDGFKITCTSADDRGIHTQHLSIDIDRENYVSDIAPARTFAVYEDIEPLLKCGKIQGGSLECAILIKGNQILSKEALRYNDEFVRHKILDIIGDMALLGIPLRCHIIAVRPGHAINAELTKKIWEQYEESRQSPNQSLKHKSLTNLTIGEESDFDINKILNTLPHRYPFVMVDRVIEFTADDGLRAIKNVTINEPYFTGHYPGHPIMPGVLQIEAMAQAAGILMLRRRSYEQQLAYFMSCDKVKFRKPVVPGDQLEIFVRIKKARNDKIGLAEGECRVNGKVVSSGELMFSIVKMA
ncbi:MAG: bifunctional UDP-3-O-[3-hydroxymyristoyl] N-acetylglucosamine deacetylase/3-hydroxyacyl-ACP dehydratase [Puniceicoccales bacterium]|jgi:UDP-3-O-[3-hydroxymyristoyl] N-acetylglucosamine deacetylase/3-hydroxyacyl-[acyl-carrier-protein] dehydratase|nr:bifunctional UDP-3-O-[3-hydroxymyristoyl] N-acetylglucosamine deacetylase/3-hydroxyacyl-ACP dehydratase [Puniceicoccales bacterium]